MAENSNSGQETTLNISLRPKTFEEIVGQDEVVQQIKNRIALGRIPRAWMFSGPPGVGKTSLARILARHVQGPDFPANQKLELDFMEIDTSHHNSVDDMRELIEISRYRPIYGCKYRVIFLDEAQRLREAQYLLAKPFEKEDSSTIWIIATTEPDKISGALRRRCACYELKVLNNADIEKLVCRALAKTEYHGGQEKQLINDLLRKGVRAPGDIVQEVERWLAENGRNLDVRVKDYVGDGDAGEPAQAPPSISPQAVAELAVAAATKPAEKPNPAEMADPWPEFPRVYGVLHDLAEVIAPSLAYAPKVLGLFTCVGLSISGEIALTGKDTWLQPRFYACAVSPPGQTKSAADKEVRRALFGHDDIPTNSNRPTLSNDVEIEFSINSGPALVQAFYDIEPGLSPARLLLSPDELSSMLDKAKRTGLFGEFLRLYDSNEAGRNVVRKKKFDLGANIKLTNAHLAVFGGATPQNFEKLWQGTGGHATGLQSRFTLCYSDKALPVWQQLTDESAVQKLVAKLVGNLKAVGKTISFSAGAQEELDDLASFMPESIPPRILDMGKKWAMILAASCGRNVIDVNDANAGMGFAWYQMDIKARLMPPDSATNAQAFEHRIVNFFEKHGQATKNEARRIVHPEKHLGGHGSFNGAFNSLVKSGRLKVVGRTKTRGTEVYELEN